MRRKDIPKLFKSVVADHLKQRKLKLILRPIVSSVVLIAIVVSSGATFSQDSRRTSASEVAKIFGNEETIDIFLECPAGANGIFVQLSIYKDLKHIDRVRVLYEDGEARRVSVAFWLSDRERDFIRIFDVDLKSRMNLLKGEAMKEVEGRDAQRVLKDIKPILDACKTSDERNRLFKKLSETRRRLGTQQLTDRAAAISGPGR